MIVAGAQGEIKAAWARSGRWKWTGPRLRVAVIPETSTGESEPVYKPMDDVEFRKEPAARDGQPGVEIVGSYDGVEVVVEFRPH